MNKLVFSFAVVAGLFGVALMTRVDVLYSLPIGGVLIAISGGLFFIIIKASEKVVKAEHKTLLESLSLEDIKNSLATATDCLRTISESNKSHTQQIIEQVNNTPLQINGFLVQFLNELKTELKEARQQQLDSYKATTEAIIKAVTNINEHQINATKSHIQSHLNSLKDTIKITEQNIVERIDNLNNVSRKTSEVIGELSTILQSEAKVLVEQQRSLNELLLYDIKETLTEFTENQTINAEAVVDSIKKTMRETNNILNELPLSLVAFSNHNAEIVRKSIEGYAQFEKLMNTTLEQITSISNQDYDLLKEMMK